MRLGWLAAVMLLAGCGKYEVRTREVGYTGAAKANPYLAAERLLDACGLDASSSAGWSEGDGARVGTLVVPASFLNSRGRISQMASWVSGGGHLIILCERGEAYWDDFAPRSAGMTSKEEPNNNLDAWLRDNLGVVMRRAEQPAGPLEVLHDGRTLTVAMPSSTVFDLEFDRVEGEFGDADSEYDAAQGHRLLSLLWDEGRITLLASADPMRNRFIGNHDHATLLVALARLSRPGKVIFIYGGGVSFAALLWERAWAGLLGLAVVLIIWLWRSLPRFGPLCRPAEEVVQGGYLRHIEAVGDFLWRHGRAGTLLDPLRREIMERFEHHKAGALDADLFDWLGARAGLPRERVARALTDVGRPDGATYARMMADLQQIRETL